MENIKNFEGHSKNPMKHKFILEVGYDDGNANPLERVKYISSRSFKDISEAHEKLVKLYNIDISTECDYDEPYLSKDFVEKIAEHGFTFDSSYGKVYMGAVSYTELYMGLAKIILPDLEFQMVPEDCKIHNIGGMGCLC